VFWSIAAPILAAFSKMLILVTLIATFITSSLVAPILPSATRDQAYTFTNRSVDYVIEFPSSKWRVLPSSGIVSARTRKEFSYSGKVRVRLLVRRKLVDASTTPSDMVRRRQTWDQHLAGYVLSKEESFSGRLSGTKFSYEYTRGGKPMTAIIYYLEADTRTIYSLLFRGPRDDIQRLHGEADAIARSFRLKRFTRS
jgi:hypothetical protein